MKGWIWEESIFDDTRFAIHIHDSAIGVCAGLRTSLGFFQNNCTCKRQTGDVRLDWIPERTRYSLLCNVKQE